MKIAQIAPLAEAVPPKLYGGTERIVSYLTDALVDLGHHVTLFASGDSSTRAALVAAWPRSLRLAKPRPDPTLAYTALLEEAAEAAADFDVMHFHLDWMHLPLFQRLNVPFLTTLHGRLDLPGLDTMVRRFPDAPFVSISDAQRSPVPRANWIGTVHHGLPPDVLRPTPKPQGYLAFLGRMSPEKGPEAAIRIARAANLPLRMAAKVARAERQYFHDHLEPLIDGALIRFEREINEARKSEFLGNAAALLFPIDWPEPFGLVMIEAMACGTPVIASRQGSVPEVIEHGVTGFLVSSEDEALDAIRHVGEIDRARVRAEFERRFTARRMAEDYVRLYRLLAPQHRFVDRPAAAPSCPPMSIEKQVQTPPSVAER